MSPATPAQWYVCQCCDKRDRAVCHNVNKAWAVDDTTLYLEFDDGRRGTYDMSDLIGVGVFERLSDPAEFRAARSDGFTVVWPCGLDIAPEELYENCVAL